LLEAIVENQEMLMNEAVFAYGRIFYIPIRKSNPPLPEMSLLFLKKDEQGDVFTWRATCIDLEIDASGNTRDEAWENLKKSLTLHIDMEIGAADGSVIEAAKKITRTAFEYSSQKEFYFGLYRQAKLEYTMKAIEKGKLDLLEREKQRLERMEMEDEPIMSFVEELAEAA
jgi:hypothetical protein